ncbi:sphingomyelin phosphodiesterase 4-like isoform X2 [Montipora foliosa]|uniref:sphingomyelin phosphodiesterase 4-like isoform X2 n=1 Tax=Montipora foliosa TaxID=591990 RepID=UPI0035F20CF2
MNGDFTSKTREALQHPLHQRCEEIEKLIESFSAQNLHGFFPQLLSSIFGYSGGTDWGLRTLLRESRDFAAVRRFLSPEGAVFKLINLLQEEDQHRYEFFITCLPFPTQTSLSEGIVPVLYQNKVPMRGPGETVSAVLLNTFEYYMFHFAYYIVAQQTSWESNANSTQDFLYLVILDDYLNFFLPSDGSPISSSSIKSKSTVGQVRKNSSSWHDLSHCRRPQYFQNQFKGLIKPCSGRVSPPTVHHGMFDHGSQEMWRSETFLQIMIEFWLNQNTVHSISSNVLSHGKEYFMPSVDHVRVVRILVKHVHSFVYAKGPDVSQFSSLHPSDELKRAIIPQFLQKKLYHFLHHCFLHWPLDPSFRIVLETWLSYVQPWRYCKVGMSLASGAENPRGTSSLEWKFFIFENLLFYSALLLEFASRACRFNLNSAKDAHLLFRVIKVFSQPHLMEMIEEGENAYLKPQRNGYDSPQTNFNTPSSVIKAHIMELEGPSYALKSLFHYPGAIKMGELHSRVLSALTEVTNKSQSQCPEKSESFLAVFMKAVNSSTSQGTEFDKNAEEGKLASYLEQTSKLLSGVVKSPDSVDGCPLNKTIQWEHFSPGVRNRHSSSGSQSSLPDHVETDGGVVPTALGRYQMMNGLRKFEVKYSGDPELQPIRSFENPTLVRLLYKLSTYLNEKFGNSLETFYASSKPFRGVASFLSPALRSATLPTPSRHQSSSSPHSPEKQVQPLISLRFLSSYRTMFYLLIFWFFCKVTSLHGLFVVLLWVLLLFVMLIFHLRTPFQKR